MLGKIHFIVPKFWEKSRMRSATQPYCSAVEYGCVSLRMRFFSQNFGTIKRILPRRPWDRGCVGCVWV